MGHFGKVGDNVLATNVLADADDERVRLLVSNLTAKYVAYHDRLAVGVRNLNANRGLARNRRKDTYVRTCYCVGDVFRQRRNAVNFDAGAELHFVLRDRGPAGEADHLSVNRELIKYPSQRVNHGIVSCRALHVRGPLDQHVHGRERVGDVRGKLHLLNTLGKSLRLWSLECGLASRNLLGFRLLGRGPRRLGRILSGGRHLDCLVSLLDLLLGPTHAARLFIDLFRSIEWLGRGIIRIVFLSRSAIFEPIDDVTH